MMFEDFSKNVKAINEIVNDEDVRDILSHVDFIEKKLKNIAGKNNNKLYFLIGEAIKKIPLGWIVELSETENLGYKISSAVDLFDGGYCREDVYDCLVNNEIYVVTNGRGFVKLMDRNDLEESDQYKHVINMIAHNYELILNIPDMPVAYKEPIIKIDGIFKILGVKEN